MDVLEGVVVAGAVNIFEGRVVDLMGLVARAALSRGIGTAFLGTSALGGPWRPGPAVKLVAA